MYPLSLPATIPLIQIEASWVPGLRERWLRTNHNPFPVCQESTCSPMTVNVVAMRSAALNRLPGVRSLIRPSSVGARHPYRLKPGGAHQSMTNREKCYMTNHGTQLSSAFPQDLFSPLRSSPKAPSPSSMTMLLAGSLVVSLGPDSLQSMD
jgi:hypothetical protein